GGDRLRGEGLVGRVRGQRPVQLGRAPPEELGQVEVVAEQVLGQRAGLAVGYFEQRRQVVGIRVEAFALGEQALVVAAERAEGVAPGVALVGDQLVQYGDGSRLVVVIAGSVLE